MAKYIDGFLLPVKAENVDKYKELAQKAGEVWRELGALQYVEANLDDPGHEEMVSFKKSAVADEGETVIFAFIVFESKEDRDRINALVMEDERMKEMMSPDEKTFDYRRMSYGGFDAIVDL